MRKRVTFYLKSGNIVKFRAREITITKNNQGITGVNWSGATHVVAVTIEDIECVTVQD